jgi:hypothetical protein
MIIRLLMNPEREKIVSYKKRKSTETVGVGAKVKQKNTRDRGRRRDMRDLEINLKGRKREGEVAVDRVSVKKGRNKKREKEVRRAIRAG